MTEYAFFAEKVDRWGKDIASLWGNLNICPQLYQLELPCHSQAELFSISSLKVWGNVQKPYHDIAYLLVWVENAMKDRHYGISLVWVTPNQVRAATMEEVVEKLTACTSHGTNWPYTLAQLYEGFCHAPLPKDKHLGILPQGKVQETPCGQINQLKVCQLLAAGPQVVYPIGFKWAWWVYYNHSTRATGQWYKPHHKQTYLLGDWYPLTPSGGTRPKDTTSRQGLHHPDNQPT